MARKGSAVGLQESRGRRRGGPKGLSGKHLGPPGGARGFRQWLGKVLVSKNCPGLGHQELIDMIYQD